MSIDIKQGVLRIKRIQPYITGLTIEEVSKRSFIKGTRVKSILGGGFQGTVVAFESSGRIVCQSDKDNSRVRYAYWSKELQILNTPFNLVGGKVYINKKGRHIRVTECPLHLEFYCLIDDSTGHLLGITEGSIVSEEDLNNL